ncbi:MAG: RDD family protein [Ekhidna sp.]
MIKINNKYAGFWPRLLAHNIDLLPILMLYYLASFIIPKSDYDYVFIIGIYFLYHILFEVSPMQGTPGKKWTKIKVTNSEEDRITLIQAIVRNVTKVFSLLLLFGGFVAILFNSKRRALHDYIGGTLVLFDED